MATSTSCLVLDLLLHQSTAKLSLFKYMQEADQYRIIHTKKKTIVTPAQFPFVSIYIISRSHSFSLLLETRYSSLKEVQFFVLQDYYMAGIDYGQFVVPN